MLPSEVRLFVGDIGDAARLRDAKVSARVPVSVQQYLQQYCCAQRFEKSAVKRALLVHQR